VFTYHLIEGLQGKADANGDSQVTADEIFKYVQTNVQRDTDNKQHPTLVNANRLDYSLLLASATDRPILPSSGGQPIGTPRASVDPAGVATGALLLTSDMSAEVRVDDGSPFTLDAQSPTLLSLPRGAHDVKAERKGFKPVSYRVTIDAANQTPQQIALEAEAA